KARRLRTRKLESWRDFSDSQCAPEATGGVIRFSAVVIEKDGVVSAIAKESAAEFSDIRRSLYPARRFPIELAKFLQPAILLFRKELNAQGRCHIRCAASCFVFFP